MEWKLIETVEDFGKIFEVGGFKVWEASPLALLHGALPYQMLMVLAADETKKELASFSDRENVESFIEEGMKLEGMKYDGK